MTKATRLSNRIRDLRHLHDAMTQGELAESVGVTRQTINAIEQAKYSPSLEVAFLIAEVFATTVDDVFRLEDRLQTEPTRLRDRRR